jgi:hypothetical protein
VAAPVIVRCIRPSSLILLAAAVVIGIVFFASSHPLRGGLFVVLAVTSWAGAWFSTRTARAR